MRWLLLLMAPVLIGGLGYWLWRADAPTAPPQSETSESGYRLEFRACDFQLPWRADIRCADLYPPQPPSDRQVEAFRLPVVIIRASGPERKDDPVLYLQGGPGAPARLHRAGIESWLSWLDYAHLERDLVLMDHRGAGRSAPALECPEYDRLSREILRENADFEQELEQGSAVLRQCFERLAQEGKLEPSRFGTLHSARDVAGLMAELRTRREYTQWNLIGVSYGSRLAMAVADLPTVREAGWVRTLVLDSVYPPDQGGLLSWPRVMTEGIERFFAWCEGEATCAESAVGLDQRFDRALAALAEEPLTVPITLWQERREARVIVNDHRLLSTVFNGIYHRHRWPQIPKALAAAEQRDPEGLQPLLEPFINTALDEDFSSLGFMAVDCRDHPMGTREDYRAELERYPRFSAYLEGLWDTQSCHWLGGAEQPLSVPGTLPAPTLMLAGALDPITPLDWARNLAQTWPEAQLYELENSGHSAIGSSACVHRKLADFLNQPEATWQPECEE